MQPPRAPLGTLLIAIGLACPFGRAEAAPAPDAANAGLASLATGAEQELKGNILPFWLKYTRNPGNGGYYGFIRGDMKVRKDSARGALLTSRMLWTFSEAYRVYRDPAYLEMAHWAYRDLMDHFRDPEFGGLYWEIAADGRPTDPQKLIYGQAFGIYALTNYYRATGDKPALDEAIAIYNLVEKNARDLKYGGYLDSLDRMWGRPGIWHRNLLGDAPKSQNSHIHILEAYTALLRVWPDAGLRASQRDLVEMVIRHIIDPRTHHLIMFMKEDWTPTSGEVSYGHDIELSWLLVEAADVLGDPALVGRVKPIAVAMADAALAQGIDPDGGLINGRGGSEGLGNNKDWWPQAEAVTGFLNAYQISGEPRFLQASRHSWEFIQAKMVDRAHGDWYETLRRDGTPIPGAKVSVWKCPYHNARCCFEVMKRVRELTGERAAP